MIIRNLTFFFGAGAIHFQSSLLLAEFDDRRVEDGLDSAGGNLCVQLSFVVLKDAAKFASAIREVHFVPFA